MKSSQNVAKKQRISLFINQRSIKFVKPLKFFNFFNYVPTFYCYNNNIIPKDKGMKLMSYDSVNQETFKKFDCKKWSMEEKKVVSSLQVHQRSLEYVNR